MELRLALESPPAAERFVQPNAVIGSDNEGLYP